MSKINRFFERIIKEETSSDIINMDNVTFYAYGISGEEGLYSLYDKGYLILCSRNDYAQSLAESSATTQLLGNSEIPTVIKVILNGLKILQWSDELTSKYGELFKGGIIAPQKFNENIIDNFSQYDGIINKGNINDYLILFNSEKAAIYQYQFYTAEHGWGDWYKKQEAIDFLDGLFTVKDTSSFFN